MKIAIDISQIAYQGTGVANYTENLVRNLLKLDKDNQYILFGYSLRKRGILKEFIKGLSEKFGNIKGFILPLPSSLVELFGQRFSFFKLENITGKIDIYHSSDWIQLPSLAAKITTVHDLIIFKYPNTSHSRIIDVGRRRMKKVLKECRMILADSLTTRKDLIEILAAEENKIEVVYPGISGSFYPRGKEEIEKVKQKYHISGEYFLTVGKNEPRKNMERIIGAYAVFRRRLQSKKSLPQFVCVGKKGWGEEFESDKNIINLGYVEDMDLPALYSGALFFVYIPLYEGFGLPVVEAMASGCPVITADVGSLNELGGRESLKFVNPESIPELTSAMLELHNSRDLRKKLSRNGLKQAVKFSWEKSAAKILKIYESLG